MLPWKTDKQQEGEQGKERRKMENYKNEWFAGEGNRKYQYPVTLGS